MHKDIFKLAHLVLLPVHNTAEKGFKKKKIYATIDVSSSSSWVVVTVRSTVRTCPFPRPTRFYVRRFSFHFHLWMLPSYPLHSQTRQTHNLEVFRPDQRPTWGPSPDRIARTRASVFSHSFQTITARWKVYGKRSCNHNINVYYLLKR